MSIEHPTSEYEEYVEVPGLTLYDIHRKPRQVLEGPKSDESNISKAEALILRIPLNKLRSEFNCPICLKVMVKTTIVMECLHRFCADCIEKCLRLGMKECPSCRVHIPSRRNMRRDVNYDKLIHSLFGNIEKLDEMEDQYVTSINQTKFMNKSHSASRKRGIEHQISNRAKKKKGENNVSEVTNTDNETPQSRLVNFVLRRHPQEVRMERLRREYLRVSSEITLGHLAIFLKAKLGLDGDSNDIQFLTLNDESEGVELESTQTVGVVEKNISNSDNFVIHYRFNPKVSNIEKP